MTGTICLVPLLWSRTVTTVFGLGFVLMGLVPLLPLVAVVTPLPGFERWLARRLLGFDVGPAASVVSHDGGRAAAPLDAR